MTPAQRQALEHAHATLAVEQAGELPPGIPPEGAGAYWRGYLRGALQLIAEAFPERGRPRPRGTEGEGQS